MISYILVLKHVSYQDYTLCVQRQEWAFHTYFSLARWWFLISVDKDHMRSIGKV